MWTRPRSPKPSSRSVQFGMSEALFSVASALSDDQGLDVALAYAQLALSIDGDREINLTLLGDIYESMNSYQRSIEAYDAIDKSSVLNPMPSSRSRSTCSGSTRRTRPRTG